MYLDIFPAMTGKLISILLVGRKSALSMAESSVLTLPGITMISNILFANDSGPTVLCSNTDFVKYILTVIHHKLSKVSMVNSPYIHVDVQLITKKKKNVSHLAYLTGRS
jgi:hypothetical protein